MKLRWIFAPLPKYFLALYKRKNILWQLVAVIATYVLVASGFDWWWHLYARNSVFDILVIPALTFGSLFPIVLPLGFLISGKILRNVKIFFVGVLLSQAAILGIFFSSLYKAFTGRIQPSMTQAVDISHNFNFGFLKHGIFWGWPSSHTTIAFAMAFALIYAYPKNKFIKYLAPIYALVVGLGVSVGIHWFSEFVAGAIFGTIIGIVIGKNFSKN